MKSTAQTTLYFSAYPLKAFDKETSSKPTTGQSPFLRAILSGKTRTSSRVRVFPMVNPYPASTKTVKPAANTGNNVQPTEKEWFNNYE